MRTHTSTATKALIIGALAAVIGTSVAATIVLAPNTAEGSEQRNVFGGIDYVYTSGVGKSNNSDASGYEIILGGKPVNWLVTDIRSGFNSIDRDSAQNNTSFNPTTVKLEVGATPIYTWNNGIGIFSRVALGYDFPSEYNSFSYGSIEPGAFYKIGDGKVSLSYRYRNELESSMGFETNSWRIGGEYALNQRDSIIAKYEYVDGDANYNSYRIGYLGHF